MQWNISSDLNPNLISNDPDGIIIRVGNQTRSTGAVTGTDPSPADPSDHMHVCVRAKLDANRFGPWVLSSAYTIHPRRRRRTSTSDEQDSAGAASAAPAFLLYAGASEPACP